MIKSPPWVSTLEEIRTATTYRKRIVERWGTESGDTREVYITGNAMGGGSISLQGKKIDFSPEVFETVGKAILEIVEASRK